MGWLLSFLPGSAGLRSLEQTFEHLLGGEVGELSVRLDISILPDLGNLVKWPGILSGILW